MSRRRAWSRGSPRLRWSVAGGHLSDEAPADGAGATAQVQTQRWLASQGLRPAERVRRPAIARSHRRSARARHRRRRHARKLPRRVVDSMARAILVWRADRTRAAAAARHLGIGVVSTVDQCLDVLVGLTRQQSNAPAWSIAFCDCWASPPGRHPSRLIFPASIGLPRSTSANAELYPPSAPRDDFGMPEVQPGHAWRVVGRLAPCCCAPTGPATLTLFATVYASTAVRIIAQAMADLDGAGRPSRSCRSATRSTRCRTATSAAG